MRGSCRRTDSHGMLQACCTILLIGGVLYQPVLVLYCCAGPPYTTQQCVAWHVSHSFQQHITHAQVTALQLPIHLSIWGASVCLIPRARRVGLCLPLDCDSLCVRLQAGGSVGSAREQHRATVSCLVNAETLLPPAHSSARCACAAVHALLHSTAASSTVHVCALGGTASDVKYTVVQTTVWTVADSCNQAGLLCSMSCFAPRWTGSCAAC
jgi:hypothetical protein